MIKYLIALLCWGMTVFAHAFPCYITVVKDSCWTKYNVSVNVIDSSHEKSIMTVEVPKGKSWSRQLFACEPQQTLTFIGSFNPVFWKDDVGKTYPAHRSWSLPEEIASGDTAWNINVCYPNDFASVPLPPDASGNCKCNMEIVPPVKPQ